MKTHACTYYHTPVCKHLYFSALCSIGHGTRHGLNNRIEVLLIARSPGAAVVSGDGFENVTVESFLTLAVGEYCWYWQAERFCSRHSLAELKFLIGYAGLYLRIN